LALQQNLDEHDARGFGSDREELEGHAGDVEVNLTIGSNADANADDDHVEKAGPAERLKGGEDRGEIHNNRGRGFEHLDEGNGKVKVGAVAHGKGESVEQPNWHDALQVDGGGDGVDRFEAKEAELHEDGAGESAAHLGCSQEDVVVIISGQSQGLGGKEGGG